MKRFYILNYLTGVRTVPKAILHHPISQYSPECEQFGKPYGTPQVSFVQLVGTRNKPQIGYLYSQIPMK
ncbi:hypothetical protein [Fluviicola chungangensis]|uniref:Uncharacterized protein n=1 Tax=Fluviicola chungangensis TaxID=2597671 RepID=A0A556MMR5_9FLAO|nr:hypothetical protein [Fluviicola chungangensis]TSJ41186.1 hypothetical protein FO442_14845 [Fluviicola chungangensis]